LLFSVEPIERTKMSRKHFNSGMGRSLAELDMDISRLCGNGGADYPHLMWQLQLALVPQKAPQTDYAFRSVAAQLYFATGQKIADARPFSLDRVIRGYQAYWGDEYLNFEFPLDARRIEAIERLRQGGSLQCRLDVQIQVDEYGAIAAHVESNRSALWGLLTVHRLTLQEGFQIPQTDWIERVLPNIGYGKVHIVEFPATPLDACAALDHSFKALKQAEEKHRLGFYDDAAGKCRLAIEPFFDYEPVDASHPESRKIPVLKKHWETKLGKATYDWLKSTLGSIKDASNLPHHSPNEHYSQLDSQMILAITTAVVAYIARTVKPEDLKTQ
jgi:hypothetical protein